MKLNKKGYYIFGVFAMVLFTFLTYEGYNIYVTLRDNPKLIFVNQTNDRLRYLEDISDVNDTIADTTDCEKGTLYDIDRHMVYTLLARGLLWEGFSKNTPNQSVHIYILPEDTFLKYGTCDVLKRQMFTKKYNITYEYGKQINWKIVYDGKNVQLKK